VIVDRLVVHDRRPDVVLLLFVPDVALGVVSAVGVLSGTSVRGGSVVTPLAVSSALMLLSMVE
jgi:hypothetical protein